MSATEAMTASAEQHKGWTWTWTWNWTLVFSYKVPTTRSTDCLSLFFFPRLSTIALKIFASCTPWQTDQHISNEFNASLVSGYRRRYTKN